MNYTPPSYNQIRWAINETLSMTQASNLLRVSYNTFKKYAQRYDLFVPNQCGKGIRKPKLNKIKQSDGMIFWRDDEAEKLRDNYLKSMIR